MVTFFSFFMCNSCMYFTSRIIPISSNSYLNKVKRRKKERKKKEIIKIIKKEEKKLMNE